MAFAPAFLPHNPTYLPGRLSMLLEPGFSAHSPVLLPHPTLPLYKAPQFNLTLSKSLGLDRTWDPSLSHQLDALNCRNLISKKIGHQTTPSFTLMANKAADVIAQQKEILNPHQLNRNWRHFNQWPKYQEQHQSSTLEAQNLYSSLDLAHVLKRPRTYGPEYTIDRADEESKRFGHSLSKFSENIDRKMEMETTDNVVNISSFEMESRDIQSYISKSGVNERCKMRHSIREILKPKENSRIVANTTASSKLRSAPDDKEQTKKKSSQRGHFSWMSKRQPKSVDLIKPGKESSKDLHHMKLKHKVISVFTMASSSFTQTFDTISQKPSRKASKCQSAFDFLENTSTYSPDMTSVSNLLDAQPHSSQGPSGTRGQGDRKSFQCPQCRYLTDRKNNLKRHIVTMHQDSGKVLECCGVPFQSKAALRDHNTIFHTGGYRCQICARNFCRKALLRRHLTVHSGQKDFYCELCGYATSHKSNLERHQKVHSKRTTDTGSECVRQGLSTPNFDLNFGQTNSIKDRCSPGIRDGLEITIDIDEETIALMDKGGLENIRLTEDSEVYKLNTRPSVQEIISPSRSKGKKAMLFSSRLEETYSETLDKTHPNSSYSPNQTTSFEEMSPYNTEIHSLKQESLGLHSPIPERITNDLIQRMSHENSMMNLVPSVLDCEADLSQEIVIKERQKEIEAENEGAMELEDNQGHLNDLTTSASRKDVNATEPNKGEGSTVEPTLGELSRDADEEPHDVIKKRRKFLNHKRKMCPVFYECDGCGRNFPCQQDLQSHSCPKSSPYRLLDLSLVEAMQKGCLKSLH